MARLPLTIRASSSVGDPAASVCNGVYQGSVTNTSDPLSQGRVTLLVPQVLGTAISNWAVPVGNSALFSSVSTGQIVNVFFLGGNRNTPAYTPVNWSQAQNLVIPGNLTVDGTASLLASASVTGGFTADIINSGLSKYKIAPGGTVRTNTAVSNDPDLSGIAVTASSVYIVEANILNTGTGTGNVQYLFDVPSGSSGTYMATQYNLASQLQEIMSSSWTSVNTAGVNTGTTPVNSSIFIKGVLSIASTAGSVNFQWAQNTNNGSTTVMQFSYLRLERIA